MKLETNRINAVLGPLKSQFPDVLKSWKRLGHEVSGQIPGLGSLNCKIETSSCWDAIRD